MYVHQFLLWWTAISCFVFMTACNLSVYGVHVPFPQPVLPFCVLCVRVQVADSKGHTLFRKESAGKGRFAFTTEDYDMFEVCFYSIITGQWI